MTVTAAQLAEVVAALRSYDAGREGSRTVLDDLKTRYSQDGVAEGAAFSYPRVDDPNFHRKLQLMRDFYTTPKDRHRHGLLQHQKFVKKYMAPGTGYNGVLLLHDVGTGKTCTAVAVAEMYRPLMMKPAIVLCPSAVKQQWRDEIVNVSKATFVAGKWVLAASCANRQYAKVVGRVARDTRPALEATVTRAVNANYEFYGYLEFANRVKATRSVRETFSDRVLIIDEAHHLRSNDASNKSVHDAILTMLRECSNVKVLLLTATPMYDRAMEIIPLINLLRINDGRPELAVSDHFNKEGRFINEAAFGRSVAGYVSYVRGENPTTFPSRIPAHIALGHKSPAWPSKDHAGRRVSQPDVCEGLVTSQASALQEQRILAALSSGEVADREDDDPWKHAYMQASSIAFPTEGAADEAFAGCFKGSVKDGHMEYREPYAGILGEHLERTAPKLARIADLLGACRGVAMVYSFWISAGVLPMAVALEERGYRRVNGPPLLKTSSRANGKTYAILTSAKDITSASARKSILDKMVSPNNTDGSLVSVLLVTNTISEGVNLKHVREVHIMEPWWNMGRSEQIVGRAARYLSHAALPKAEQNLTVYHHVCSLSGDREGIDHICIRAALDKRAEITRVLRVLRAQAFDCAFNAKKLYVPLQDASTVETSQGRSIKWRVGDHDYGKACLYSECIPTEKICAANFLTPLEETRARLFEPLTDDVDIVHAYLEDLLCQEGVTRDLTLDDIQANSRVPRDVLMYALTDIIENGTRLTVCGVSGTLRQIGNVYAFVPLAESKLPRLRGDAVGEVPVAVVTLDKGADGRAGNVSLDDSDPLDVDEGIKHFIMDSPPDLAGAHLAALDAVVDRATFAQLCDLVGRADPQVLDSMRRGGLLHGAGVVAKDGKAYDTENGAPVSAPPPVLAQGSFSAYLVRGHLHLTTSGRGRTCQNMHRPKLHDMVHDSGMLTRASSHEYSKAELCRLLEVYLRMQGQVQRPGTALSITSD